jgi:hypothetical protein
MARYLNVVSFDVPFPANYGGVIDVYYKLLWLHKSGVKIYLHCFTYGRQPSSELEKLCEKVFYYNRKTGLASNFSLKPYTVVSRRSVELENNLLTNDHPILFEVLHTCYLLKDPRFKNRKKIYRHSNIEHHYYRELAKTEKNIIKGAYLRIEALKLRFFESILNHADLILAVNKKDTEYFQKKYPEVRSVYLPSFHPNTNLSVKPGKGDFILFHGNLGISENYEAAIWLIKNIFPHINFKIILAGLNPPQFLIDAVTKFEHIQIKESPNEEEMTQLIRNAQVHVLYTGQPTGLKLKLLNVLFKGRYIVCNEHMISGTGLLASKSLLICQSENEFVQRINECLHKEFIESMNREREEQIKHFDNSANIQKLITEVFEI